MNTKTIMQGGHYRKQGYHYRMYFVIPSFERSSCESITGSQQKVIKVSLPTKFMLTNSSLYTNIVFSILGLGLGLEIRSKT